MMELEQQLDEAAVALRQRLSARPKLAIVSGSGQGKVGGLLGMKEVAAFEQLPHFPRSTVEGHAGHVYAGRVGRTQALLMSGRKHYYESPESAEIVFALRVCARLGVKQLLLLNSAGGLNSRFAPGDLMMIVDLLNLQFRNPLIGPNLESVGPRFPDMSAPCDPGLRSKLIAAATELKVVLHQGTYAAMMGPTYETGAEVNMLRLAGADAVGMSTAPEAIGGIHAGLRVIGISCITNSLVRSGPPPTHREVLENAAAANQQLARLLRRMLSG